MLARLTKSKAKKEGKKNILKGEEEKGEAKQNNQYVAEINNPV